MLKSRFHRRILIGLSIIALGIAGLGFAHRRVASWVSSELRQRFQNEVSIGALQFSLPWGLIIKDVRIQDWGYVPRIEIEFAHIASTTMTDIVLHEPHLRFSPTTIQDWRTLIANPSVPKQTESVQRETAPQRAPTKKTQTPHSSPTLVVENGSASGTLSWGGTTYTITAQQLYLKPVNTQRRVYRVSTGQVIVRASWGTAIFASMGSDISFAHSAHPPVVDRLVAVDAQFNVAIPALSFDGNRAVGSASLINITREQTSSPHFRIDLHGSLGALSSSIATKILTRQSIPSKLPQRGFRATLWYENPFRDPLRPHRIAIDFNNLDLDPLFSFIASHTDLKMQRARLNGIVSAVRNADIYKTEFRVTASADSITHPVLASRSIAPAPIELVGEVSFDTDRRRYNVSSLSIAHKKLNFFIKEVDLSYWYQKIKIDLIQSRESCQSVFDSLPEGIAPTLRGMRFDGTLSTKFDVDLNVEQPDRSRIDLDLSAMNCRVIQDAIDADPKQLLHEFSSSRIQNADRTPWVFGNKNPHYRALNRISPHIVSAFITAEDNYFFQHRGFDTEQLNRAVQINLKERSIVRGASTISQQLVKNLFLSHERTLSRKLQEVILTWRTEQVLPKRRILELYLNLVGLGPGIRGVEQASRYYFGHSADHRVNPLQAVLLAALAPSPVRYAREISAQGLDQAWRDRLTFLLKLMQQLGQLRDGDAVYWSSRSLHLFPRRQIQ